MLVEQLQPGLEELLERLLDDVIARHRGKTRPIAAGASALVAAESDGACAGSGAGAAPRPFKRSIVSARAVAVSESDRGNAGGCGS